MLKKIKPIYKKLLILAGILAAVGLAGYRNTTKAGPLQSVDVTLSNSRLSVLGTLDGSAENLSIIKIAATYDADDSDNDTDQLVVGDTLTFDTDTAVVEEIVDADEIKIDEPLGTDYADSTAFHVKNLTNLTADFTTTSQIDGGDNQDFTAGYFRILVPAAASGHRSDAPDSGTFDAGNASIAVSCPTTSDGDYTMATNGSLYTDLYNDGTDNWHMFTCTYNGDGGDAAAFEDFQIQNLVMPAPKSSHVTGSADTYYVKIQHVDGSKDTNGDPDSTPTDPTDDLVVDETTVRIGAVEAVRVTATVLPTIEFAIGPVNSGTSSICGWDGSPDGTGGTYETDVTTTANTVPFGEISLSSFTRAAQTLTVTTNAANGYTVTAIANDQLKHDDKAIAGTECDDDATNTLGDADFDAKCIEDSRGDNGSMGHDTDDIATYADEWSGVTSSAVDTKGFGYSLDPISGVSNGLTLPFEHDTSGGNCTGTFCAMQFPDAENSTTEDPEDIMGNSTVADGDSAYVCYQLAAASTVSAGDYSSHITYTATATF